MPKHPDKIGWASYGEFASGRRVCPGPGPDEGDGPVCEANGCKTDVDLSRAPGGEWFCRDHFPAPPLVVEYHYADGDIGVHEIEGEAERKAAETLWRQLADPSKGGRIIIRQAKAA